MSRAANASRKGWGDTTVRACIDGLLASGNRPTGRSIMIPPGSMAVKSQRRSAGRPRSKDARGREAILDAAAAVFTERGYRGATVDAILARADLSKGTFYWHFESKDALMLALLAERVERPLTELTEVLRSAP